MDDPSAAKEGRAFAPKITAIKKAPQYGAFAISWKITGLFLERHFI